jgi:hypothetical protein
VALAACLGDAALVRPQGNRDQKIHDAWAALTRAAGQPEPVNFLRMCTQIAETETPVHSRSAQQHKNWRHRVKVWSRSNEQEKGHLQQRDCALFCCVLRNFDHDQPFRGFLLFGVQPHSSWPAKHPATKWLSAFFFTHLLVPPNDLLKFIRIMGSVLFAAGMIVFLVCALQVYASKFLKRGLTLKGLYSSIRHPQYVSLAVAGLGLAILWPRFLVVFLWVLLAGLFC